MKIILSIFIAFFFNSFFGFCKIPNSKKPFSNSIIVPTQPDKKYVVYGTPYFKTVGTKGLAIQCLYPFDRNCLMFIKNGIETENESFCLNQFGAPVPLVAELIESNTVHLGLYNDSGNLVYREITNIVKVISCSNGFFEIIFPDGY